MTRARAKLLLGGCLIAAVVIATASIALPTALRVVLGVPMVFLLPGLAATSAARPGRPLFGGEELLAIVGTSLAIATGGSVLLAALPTGLSRDSIAVLLGGITIVLSGVAWLRSHAEGSFDDAFERVGHENRLS